MAKFAPGWKGGPGRPSGSREVLTAEVLKDILADWREGGAAAVRICRIEKPDVYVRVVTSILPRELVVESITSDLSDQDLDEMIAALRARVIEQRAAAVPALETKAVIDVEPDRNSR
jgi:hypothetical protein